MRPQDYTTTENEDFVEKMDCFLADLRLAIIHCQRLRQYIPAYREDVLAQFKVKMGILDELYREAKCTCDCHKTYLECC